VILIEPGFIRTPIVTNALAADRPIEAYAAVRKAQDARLIDSVEKGDPPSEVAQAVLRAVTDENPRLRYPVGKSAGQLSLMRRFLPARMLDSGLRRSFGLDAR
jgi:NAD(P)-dependent dehydrogenase (short-subunit alcohol dehydrogenase family)